MLITLQELRIMDSLAVTLLIVH